MERIVEIYKVGRKRKDIETHLRSIEPHKNFKLIRGFAKVVERHCSFEPGTSLEPVEVRDFSSQRGLF